MGKLYFEIGLKILILLSFLGSGAGCAAVAISAAGAGAGVGLPYILTNCADRTLNFPFNKVNEVTPKVLKEMDMSIMEHIPMENGERIKASARELDIIIDMEKITAKVTKVSIDAKKSHFIKDKATAEEIINQLEKTLLKESKTSSHNPFFPHLPMF